MTLRNRQPSPFTEMRYGLWFRRDVVFRVWVDWDTQEVECTVGVEPRPKPLDETEEPSGA